MQLDHFVAAQPVGTLIWMLRKCPNLLGKTVLVQGQGQNGAAHRGLQWLLMNIRPFTDTSAEQYGVPENHNP